MLIYFASKQIVYNFHLSGGNARFFVVVVLPTRGIIIGEKKLFLLRLTKEK